MVSEAIRKQLLPFVSLEYGSQGEVSLDDTLLYVEHYQAYHEVRVQPPPGHIPLLLLSDDFRNSRVGCLLNGQCSRPRP